jgi:rhamnosyl/mannosyltransferase
MSEPTVVQVSQFYPPHTGGIETVAEKFAEAAAKEGFESWVLAAIERGFGQTECHNGVTVRRAGSLGVMFSVPIAPLLPVHYRRTVADADVVHFHLPHPSSVMSELVAGTGEYTTVASYHSDIIRQSQSFQIYEHFLKRFLNRVDRILVSSPQLRDTSKMLAPHRKKCKIVPNSIEIERFGDYDGPQYDLPVEEDRPTVLVVGRLIYYKGIKYLVEAMEDVDATLLIVGEGDRRSMIAKRIEEAGLTDRVHHLGYVPEDVLHDAYDRADLFVLPSVAPSEAFGIVQLEAMAYETPVVNTDLPTGVPWVSMDGETGRTVKPENPAALAEAIRELLASPDRRREYGRNARQRVKERFTDERTVAIVLSVYRELLDSDS